MEDYEVKKSYITTSSSVFLVRIQFRQNASWQGTIQWLDTKKTRTFRSFLEMTMLIHEGLMKKELDDKYQFRSWDDKEDRIHI